MPRERQSGWIIRRHNLGDRISGCLVLGMARYHRGYVFVILSSTAAQFDTVVIILQFLFPPPIRGRTNMIKYIYNIPNNNIHKEYFPL